MKAGKCLHALKVKTHQVTSSGGTKKKEEKTTTREHIVSHNKYPLKEQRSQSQSLFEKQHNFNETLKQINASNQHEQ